MFLASSKARRWRLYGVLFAVLAGTGYFLQRASEARPHGGSPWGLAWGILAALLVLVLLAFGLRKRAYRSRLGTLEGWLHAHVVLGLLVVAVALLHTGGRFGDRLAVWTLAVLVAVSLSGALGALLYAVLPRLLTDAESNRTAEEISVQLNGITAAMARLAGGRSAVFERVVRQLLAEATPRPLAGWRLLARRRRLLDERGLERALAEVGGNERDALRQLLVLARQHRELLSRLRSQQFYRNWLDAWLWLHIPLSIALLALMIAHAVAALWFRGV